MYYQSAEHVHEANMACVSYLVAKIFSHKTLNELSQLLFFYPLKVPRSLLWQLAVTKMNGTAPLLNVRPIPTTTYIVNI